ncbi:hypothetical protein AMS68_006337 [Peltaster fructicola]|uniref:WAC domain-containing protein n=1 Tax=Peltaster fructicola TaxID=286661 RepID=A0A6H0Y2F4_9PEZI|nr:hypothetical protein AMS68_006337 [Peltaster fructicola]
MVLYKRKPVVTTMTGDGFSDSQEVWTIAATGEVFVEYEKFLKRMDFLSQKKFTDGVNGRSGLTYFAAVESETQSAHAIENVFPEVLRDPILRKVQFSSVGRMDDLVNLIFDEFKRDFFPGEDVIVVLDNGDAMPGTIREKAKFPMIRGPDGAVQREAFSRYFVRLTSAPTEEALVDDKHLRRDKKVFTKQNLRSFLKNSLQREAWTGAPWLVKEPLAIQYRLPMEIPVHLLQDFRLIQAKQVLSKTSKARKPKHSYSGISAGMDDILREPADARHLHAGPHHAHVGYTAQAMPVHINGNNAQTHGKVSSADQKAVPAVLKYPIEDLDIPPKQNGVTRPQLKFFTPSMEDYVMNGRKNPPEDIHVETMGALLEVWNTLNVQCEVYVLDSFTFDDFVDAMKFSSDNVECELLNEVFCAVLKQIVSDTGKVEIALPRVEDSDSEEESEESQLVSEPQTPVDDPPARSTRSTRPSDANDLKANSPITPILKVHRAAEMLETFDWQANLAARDMEDGGWQMILVGLLNQLSHAPHLKAKIDQVLAYLVPLEDEPTRENILKHFDSMDINLRVQALEIITLCSVTTKVLKDFLETCSEDQTDVRKRKIEFQREKRIATEELLVKDRERKILLPDNMPGSPEPAVADISITDADLDIEESLNDESSDSGHDPSLGRTSRLRRNTGRKRKRQEEHARLEREKAEKAAAIKGQNKQSKEFLKILKDIEKLREKIAGLEHSIVECDNDLREANVQRTKVLGTDRYCNRYYWFERNGQPFGGLPTSSTAEYGYANGLIWVQGPDTIEREGFINLPEDQQAEYQARFRMTVPERRRQEEGATILESAHEWGYYDNVDRVDSLIAWLDDRGDREKKLLKELKDWRDEIAKYMDIRKKFLDDEAAKKVEADEEHATRITTRHATQKDRTAATERCLKWHNLMAFAELKHLHSQNAPKAKPKKKPEGRGVAHVVLTTRSGKQLR